MLYIQKLFIKSYLKVLGLVAGENYEILCSQMWIEQDLAKNLAAE